MTGAWDTSSVSSAVLIELCDKSTIMPSLFISLITVCKMNEVSGEEELRADI